VSESPLRVAVIEDEREVREGLAVLINGTPGFRCSGAFRSVEDAMPGIARDLPDVVITDIGLPGLSGTEGIRLMRERHPSLPFIALTVYDDDEEVFGALCAGACGYLLKNTPPSRLLESVQEVVAGGAPMSPDVARRVVRLFREFRPPERSSHQLTPQEAVLLKLLTEGHSYKTAAGAMDISTNTVSFHLRNVYSKLQVHSKSEAVAKAIRERLV
jgi:DNA-binding NarL/FixJ family response regulator